MKAHFVFLFAVAAMIGNVADAPSTHLKDEVKKAASYVLSCECGLSTEGHRYAEAVKLLEDAGGAVVPILVELLADDKLSTWFVSSAAHTAARFPFSQPFRDALRIRRDDKRFNDDSGAMLGIYEYFAQMGDRADLEWMERSLTRLDDRRTYAETSILRLRERLSRR